MAKIRMPDDFYAQTPGANVLATEAGSMNTIRTADMLFDRIGRLLRPLHVSAAGGLVLGLLRDRGSMTPSELGERLIVTRATVTGLVDSLERRGSFAGPRTRPTAVACWSRSRRPGLTCSGASDDRPWLREGLAERVLRSELRTYIELLHRIQDNLDSASDGTA